MNKLRDIDSSLKDQKWKFSVINFFISYKEKDVTDKVKRLMENDERKVWSDIKLLFWFDKNQRWTEIK